MIVLKRPTMPRNSTLLRFFTVYSWHTLDTAYSEALRSTRPSPNKMFEAEERTTRSSLRFNIIRWTLMLPQCWFPCMSCTGWKTFLSQIREKSAKGWKNGGDGMYCWFYNPRESGFLYFLYVLHWWSVKHVFGLYFSVYYLVRFRHLHYLVCVTYRKTLWFGWKTQLHNSI